MERYIGGGVKINLVKREDIVLVGNVKNGMLCMGNPWRSRKEEMKKLSKIFEKEQDEFNKLWHSYHAKYKIPYSYDERDRIFHSIVLIFKEDR